MTSVRRSKAMPTDGPTAKFLYTIIKQLDLKCIDWNLVASQLEISNGHAARMRYSRFRQQMEGISSTSRGTRVKKTGPKSSKSGGNCSKGDNPKEVTPPPMVKQEPPLLAAECESSSNPYIKAEPYSQNIPNLAEIPHVASSLASTPAPQTRCSPVPFHPMTVAPLDLATTTMYQPHAPVAYPAPPLTFEHHSHNLYPIWTPIKHEQQHQKQPEADEREETVQASIKVELAKGDGVITRNE